MNTSQASVLLGKDAANLEFTQILHQSTPSPKYLFLSGGFGVGKSLLLNHWVQVCESSGIPHVAIDIGGSPLSQLVDHLIGIMHRNKEDTRVKGELTGTNTETYYDLPLFAGNDLASARTTAKKSVADRLQQFAYSLNASAGKSRYAVFIDMPTTDRDLIASLQKMMFVHLDSNALVVIANRSSKLVAPLFQHDSVKSIHLGQLDQVESLRLLRTLGVQDNETTSLLVDFCMGNPSLLVEAAHLYLTGHTELRTLLPVIARAGIARALSEITDEPIMNLVALAGVARWFNLEILRRLTSTQRASSAYSALSQLSFFEETYGGLTVDRLLERLLFIDWVSAAPKRYEQLNAKVLRYYRTFATTEHITRPKHFVTEQIYHEYQASHDGAAEFMVDVVLSTALVREFDTLASVSKEVQSLPLSQTDNLDWASIFQAIKLGLTLQWATAQRVLRLRMNDQHATSLALGLLHLELAQNQLDSGNWQEAEITASQANRIFVAFESLAGCFFSHVCLAQALLHQRKLTAAEEALKAATETIRGSSSFEPHLKQISVYLLEAEVSRFRGQWDSAYKALQLADTIATRTASPHLHAIVDHLMGKLRRSRQEWSLAIQSFNRVADTSSSASDFIIAAQALQSLGSIYIKQTDYDAAQSSLAASMEIKQQFDDLYGIAKTLNSMAHIRRLSGDFEIAIELYSNSYEYFNRSGNLHKASRVLCRIGMAHADHGNLATAEHKLQESRALRISINDTQGISECDFELGKVAERRKDLDTAAKHYTSSLQYAATSGSSTRMMFPLVYLAAIALRKRELETGYRYLRQARRLADENRLYSFLVPAYVTRAKQDIMDNFLDLGFMLLTEAVYIGAHENDIIARDALTTLWCQLTDKFCEPDSVSTVDRYCRRSLAYWNKHCRDTDLDSILMRQLTSIDAIEALNQTGESARFISQLLHTSELISQ